LYSVISIATASDIPDLELETLNGNKQNIDSFIGKGKWTVVNIWGPGCPPCEQELPELVMFHDQNSSSHAIVVGIAIDFPSYGYAEVEKVKNYTDRFLIDFPVFLSDASVSERVGNGLLTGLPTTYLYTPDGKLVAMQVGAITSEDLTTFIDNYINKN
jgi:thiol-disulfide isomerase/thioredoxin